MPSTAGGVASAPSCWTTSCGRVAASAASSLAKRTYDVLLATPISAIVTKRAPCAFRWRRKSLTSHSYHRFVVPVTVVVDSAGSAGSSTAGLSLHDTPSSDHAAFVHDG